MNAAEARQLKKQAEIDRLEAARALEKEKERQTKTAIAKALETEVPFCMREITRQIKDAAKNGYSSTEWSWNADEIGAAIRTEVRKQLEAKGYKTTVGYDSGSTDMGDFNAPCVIYYSHYTLKIEW